MVRACVTSRVVLLLGADCDSDALMASLYVVLNRLPLFCLAKEGRHLAAARVQRASQRWKQGAV